MEGFNRAYLPIVPDAAGVGMAICPAREGQLVRATLYVGIYFIPDQQLNLSFVYQLFCEVPAQPTSRVARSHPGWDSSPKNLSVASFKTTQTCLPADAFPPPYRESFVRRK